MTVVEWRTPAVTWRKETIGGPAVLRPGIVSCVGDTFLDDFLALMEGRVHAKTPRHLADQLLPPGTTHKLFQPAHGCYYLLVGSLVCRQLSLPDKIVAKQNNEQVSFVIRRLRPDAQNKLVEQAWVEQGATRGWQTVEHAAKLLPNEERIPMHHVDTCASYDSGTDTFADAFGLSACGQRTLYYGYIPVSNREKYAERAPVATNLDPTRQFQAFVQSVIDSGEAGHDPRKDDVEEKLIKPWRGLYTNPITGSGPAEPVDDTRRKTFSLYLLLDMLDIIGVNLPTLYNVLNTNDGGALAGKRKALFTKLHDLKVKKNGADIALSAALQELKPYLVLVRDPTNEGAVSASDYASLIARYNLPSSDPNLADLQARFNEALDEERTEREANNQPWAPTPSAERIELLRDQVVPQATGEDLFIMRMVYERPTCCPVVSAPSGQVTFAKFFDPDAPARHIRIELPSIKPRDLRKYKRGVGLEMSPELRNMMNRVHKGLLDGEDLAGGVSLQLGMICSFSLQIIFLVAFIVMFIFLIAFNFIFWWLPFLKICFPIPKKG